MATNNSNFEKFITHAFVYCAGGLTSVLINFFAGNTAVEQERKQQTIDSMASARVRIKRPIFW